MLRDKAMGHKYNPVILHIRRHIERLGGVWQAMMLAAMLVAMVLGAYAALLIGYASGSTM